MKYVISSTIDNYITVTGDAAMKNKKHSQPVIKSESNGELAESKSLSDDEKELDANTFHHRSEATTSKKGMFHRVKMDHNGVQQITNVNVQIEQAKEDDAVTGCFKSLFKCLK